SDVFAGLDTRSALPHDDGTAGHQLPAKHFHAQTLRVRIAPVFGTAKTFFMCHALLLDDLVDRDARVVLAMSDGALVLLFALELEHQHFVAASLLRNGALHPRTFRGCPGLD